MDVSSIFPGMPNASSATLDEVVQHARLSYTSSIGLQAPEGGDRAAEREFLYNALEGGAYTTYGAVEKARPAQLVVRSAAFDEYVHRKLRNVKRYGAEGIEGIVVAMDELFATAAQSGVQDVVIASGHRGRLNVLHGLLQFSASSLFRKMRGLSLLPSGALGVDDVLSHIAQSVDLGGVYGTERFNVSMIHNPSHLEAADPAAVGKARSKMDHVHGGDASRVLALQVHGDAAVIGQGVVPETMNMARLPGYTVGGSVHLIVNNQLGFTTESGHGRSSRYASDYARFIDAPAIHVNGYDLIAVARAARIAAEYRARFQSDIFLDVIAHRKYGHNELDDPSFTNPSMYENIAERMALVEALAHDEHADAAAQDQLLESINAHLDSEYAASVSEDFVPATSHLAGAWAGFRQGTTKDMMASSDSGYEVSVLQQIGEASVQVPSGVRVHPRLVKGHVDTRKRRLIESNLDWATAEALALGSVLVDGHNVRIAGQDVGRGTFSHRHLEVTCQKSGQRVVPFDQLYKLSHKVGKLSVVNSPLSEAGVIGFEYGYAIDRPSNLVIWEAQFGDFANTGQVAFDTLVTCSEDKWLRQHGMVVLLPHGYDGAGPEHSSARIERWLQLASAPVSRSEVEAPPDAAMNPGAREHTTNFSVVNATTPANYFHALRRQVCRDFRKPLVVIAPKALLRHPQCGSGLHEMAPGTSFQPVLVDHADRAAASTSDAPVRVLLCSGKLRYELLRERAERKLNDQVAIVRLEELTPFPFDALDAALTKVGPAAEVCWIQEEPENGGAYSYVAARWVANYAERFGSLRYIGSPAIGTAAYGVATVHNAVQKHTLDAAFDGLTVTSSAP